MKLAVVGSRGWRDPVKITTWLVVFCKQRGLGPEDLTIVSGGAFGVDIMAEDWADKYKGHGMKKIIHRPDYKKYHPKQAPLERNKLIAKDCDEMVCFWDGKSTGSMNAINATKKLKKPTFIVEESHERQENRQDVDRPEISV